MNWTPRTMSQLSLAGVDANSCKRALVLSLRSWVAAQSFPSPQKATGKAGIVIAASWVMPNPVFDDAAGNLLPSEACVANEIEQKIGMLIQVVGFGNLLGVGGTIAP